MNQLPESKRAQILSCLTEGMAVRATARVTGVSNGAVLRLIAEIGPACEAFHHRFVHDVNCKRVELDELHQFVYGKSRCLPPELKKQRGIRHGLDMACESGTPHQSKHNRINGLRLLERFLLPKKFPRPARFVASVEVEKQEEGG